MTTQTTTDQATQTTQAGSDRLRHQMIFVNLPVADVDATRAFFTAVGYGFDETMCNEQALCLELGPNLYAMLLRRDFFAGFHQDTTAEADQREVLTCVSATSREEVDRIVDAAVAAGGREGHQQEQGTFMYGRSYADLDGHVWEIMWMDVAAAAEPGAWE